MDGNRFDALTKHFAAAASRRQIVKAFGGGIAAGLVALVGRSGVDAARPCPKPQTPCGPGTAKVCVDKGRDVRNCGSCGHVCPKGQTCTDGECVAKNDSTDAGVRLFEKLAARMTRVTGDCEALALAADEFRREHHAELQKIAAREQQWDAEERSRVATAYQERITRAHDALRAAVGSCQFSGTPSDDLLTRPGAVTCGAGCDCACICPISGWDCAWSFFGCLGGSEASCCWFGACAGNICDEQCPNCCNCGVSSCG